MNSRLMKMLPMISCQKASVLISASMDRRLSIGETINLKMHLWMCGACVQVLRQWKGLQKLLKAYHQHLTTKPLISSRLSPETKDKIKHSLL